MEAALDLGQGWTLSSYLTANKVNARGSDYDSTGVEGGITVRPEEVLGFKVSGSLVVAQQNYTNLNSLSGFTVKRQDRPVQGTVTVLFKQIERWIGYAPALSLTFVSYHSDIQVFRYHRWIPQLELGLNVLSF